MFRSVIPLPGPLAGCHRRPRVVVAHVVAVDAHIEVVKAPANGPASVVHSFAAFALMQESSDAWTLRLLRVHRLPPAVRGDVRWELLKNRNKR